MGKFHGLSKTPLYKVWAAMKSRCGTPSDPAYHNYGGRGIKVCDRWLDYRNFHADMSPRPEGGTLEREDNDKGYSPANCRWATHKEQCRNTRQNKRYTYKGHTLLVCEWVEVLGVKSSTLRVQLFRAGEDTDKVFRKYLG